MTRTTSRGSPRCRRSAGSTATRSASRRPWRRRGSPPAARSAPSRSVGSHSCARRGIMRSTTEQWGSASSGTPSSQRDMRRRSSDREGRHRRLGRAPRERHRGARSRRRLDPVRLAPRVAVLPGTGGPDTSDETIVNIPLAAGSGDAAYAKAFRRIVEPAVRSFEPGLLIVSAGFDAHVDDPLAHMAVTADGFRDMAARCTQLPRRSPRCSKAATTSRRCPASSRRRSTASTRRRHRRQAESAQRNGRGAARPSRCGSTPLAPARNLRAQSMRRRPSIRHRPDLDERHPSRWGISDGSGGASAGPWRGARAPRGGTRHRACGAGS